ASSVFFRNNARPIPIMRVNIPYKNLTWAGATFLLLIAAASPARADYSSTVVSQGPQGYWRLNETTQPPVLPILATNAGNLGAAGNGTYILANRGQIPGAIVSEPNGAAVGFDGIGGVSGSNRVRVPFQPQWNPTGPLTVEFWAKPAQTNDLA